MGSGGTELAPMSTTPSLEVAVRYGLSASTLLFRLSTESFMDRGADLTYLSAFPDEVETLYSPLCFMQPTGKRQTLVINGVEFTVVEVIPHFAS